MHAFAPDTASEALDNNLAKIMGQKSVLRAVHFGQSQFFMRKLMPDYIIKIVLCYIVI